VIRAVLAAALLLSLAACGTGNGSSLNPPTAPKGNSLLITWSSDGNPLVPICDADLANCKASITVLDQTTGVATNVPIGSNAYYAPNSTDTYQVRVNGYDWKGLAISSAYETVTVGP
jgi:hypothetical protein